MMCIALLQGCERMPACQGGQVTGRIMAPQHLKPPKLTNVMGAVRKLLLESGVIVHPCVRKRARQWCIQLLGRALACAQHWRCEHHECDFQRQSRRIALS